jgi:glycerol-3-phosphate dehydrogenase
MTPAMAAPALDRRARDLAALSEGSWDLVVVGGGIVGTGILLDAVSRGLRAALVEQDDLGVGTSSRSSRLIHGGLRYLERLDFSLVHEALAERSRLLRIAPHIVRIEPFLFPVFGIPGFHRAFYGAGLVLYDLFGAARDGGRARHLSAGGALRVAPGLRRRGLRGGILYHDGVEDDARLVIAVARTALARGGVAVTRARAERQIPGRDGQVAGVVVRDLLSGAEVDVRARHVIDATGVWAVTPNAPFAEGRTGVVPSRGSHIIVRRDRLPITTGMTLRAPGKVHFIIPWPDHWIIGTTDIPDAGAPERPSPTVTEIDELFDAVNGQLDADLGPADVVGAYTGLRPLAGSPGGDTVAVSREHRITTTSSGVVRISGGKYTTYRVMARDAVDSALGAEAKRRPSTTADLPLVGAAPVADLPGLAASIAQGRAVPESAALRLVDRHGAEARDLLDAAGPGGEATLWPGGDHLEAEVRWAVREELALSLDDILARRMRLAMLLPDRGASIARRVAELAAPELGWDAAGREAEVAAYLENAHREYDLPEAVLARIGIAGAPPAPPPMTATAAQAREDRSPASGGEPAGTSSRR